MGGETVTAPPLGPSPLFASDNLAAALVGQNPWHGVEHASKQQIAVVATVVASTAAAAAAPHSSCSSDSVSAR